MKSLVTFFLGDEEFAVCMDQVVHIIGPHHNWGEACSEAHSPASIQLPNGEHALLIDMKGMLGATKTVVDADSAYYLVIDCSAGLIAFMVDRMHELVARPNGGEIQQSVEAPIYRNSIRIQPIRIGGRSLGLLSPCEYIVADWHKIVDAEMKSTSEER